MPAGRPAAAPGPLGSPKAPDAGAVPNLSLDHFVVRGHEFLVSDSQDVFVMVASHTHSHVEINYLLEGGVTYLLAGRTARLDVGDLALFWGAIPHQTAMVDPGTRYVCIYVPLEMFLDAELGETFRSAVLGGGMIVSAKPDRFDARRLQGLVDDVRRERDERMTALLAAETHLLLRRLDITGWRDLLAGQHEPGRAQRGAMPAKVIEMTRFIAEHGHEAITVADVARAAGLHPNYAMTRFRSALGMTVNTYILRHRMMSAQTLLISSDKDIASVAFEIGFGSVSQFHRSFQSHFHCTPKEFRRRMTSA